LAVLVLVGATAGLALGYKHEPGYYTRSAVEPRPERKELSKEFLKQFFNLVGRIENGAGAWTFSFPQEQINSFFEEDFVRLKGTEALRKAGISEPRVTLEDDRIRLGFRYGEGAWSTVVTYDLRAWLAPKEVNVIALQILGRKVGGLPIASQTVLTELKEVARNWDLDVTWYRHEGHPVALLRLPSGHSRYFAQLLGLEVRHGQINVSGNSPQHDR
jgi:hypothetical protein